MIVLAVYDGHDSGACLIRDGRIVLHSSEERRNNTKHSRGIPHRSVEQVLDRAGIAPDEIDQIALASTIRTLAPGRKKRMSAGWYAMNMASTLARSEAATRLARRLLTSVRGARRAAVVLDALGLSGRPIKAYDHHLCHAACAYYHRPWRGTDGDEPVLVLTHDGGGDGLCASVGVGRDGEIEVLSQTPRFHSLANSLYSGITEHLGLKPWEHEYKVMGMAPYGRAEYTIDLLRPLFGVEGLHFRNHTGRTVRGLRALYRRLLFQQRFDNISAATQQLFEELELRWVQNAVEHTGVRDVCAAGGAFLNVKANMLIRECDAVRRFYAYPASDDGGIAVGGAILGYLDLCARRGVSPELDLPDHMFLGFSFSDEEVESAIRAAGNAYERMEDPAGRVASLLAEGRIVARFDGGEEVGPRALGNRSILADPRRLEIIRKINFAIKKRDFWMPFAVSILEEDAARYLLNPSGWAYYMIEAFDTTEAAQGEIIAGLHPFDRTVRPQIVNGLNPGYRELIRRFRDLTGVGAVLNTSFNLHGSPIVGTPEIAIETLEGSELDALVLGPFLVHPRRGAGASI